ncbi:MAG TPA: tRNA (adenosine(37)-N6)-threonylcarbamoyltransferase complex ATPase subunit type 1 TsaE [Firmicutes bacterium]|nr:tRNA (adenosine(37)-N6)-threonylcarbamoyltransferase complex ATPase subunit type 1 TsaE [Bacillota bacterium]
MALGMTLAQLLQPGDVVSLEGDLGAGKTQLAKGIGAGLGIAETVITSPSYTLINQYEGKYPLYHFDVYRIEPVDLEDLGYEEYFFGKGICLVEWGNQIREYLPTEYLQIIIEQTAIQQREFTLIAHGERYQQLLDQLEVVVQA